MAEPLRISIIDRTDSREFQQLCELLIKFNIDIFVRNKPEYAELKRKQKYDIVNKAVQEFEELREPSILTKQDIEQLKKNIEEQISCAKELIEKKTNGNIETRYYVMKDGEKMVSFQQAQIVKDAIGGTVEGWRNLAYIEPEYTGEFGQAIDSRGELHRGFYSKIIYDDIGKWFEENGVEYERTTTGVNMLQNIKAYITNFGFLPFDKNDKTIFLMKTNNHIVSKATLRKIFDLYCQHRERSTKISEKQLIDELDSISEFEELSDEQKQGLTQCFLKESEKEFEITDNDLKELNVFIDENLRNKRNGTDYEFLYDVSRIITRGLKIKNRHTDQITTPFLEEETKNVALQFFKSLDQDIYEKVKTILDGKSEFDFNMYQFREDEDFSKTKDDGMPIHTRIPCVISKNGKNTIYVPCHGTIEDVYLLVHELSHTFDFVEGDNDTRNLLGEVTPHCFETMLSQYLLENNIASKEEIANREIGNYISHYDDGVETFAKLELMKVKEKKGKIKKEDIIEIQKKYGITNGQLVFIINRMRKSEPNVDYKARYMIAQLVYPHYMEQYKQNPKKAIQTIKEYYKQVQSNNLMGSLASLGIEPNMTFIPTLIQVCNNRMKYLEEIRNSHKKGKDGMNDCLADEKTRLSEMQYASRTTKEMINRHNLEKNHDGKNIE